MSGEITKDELNAFTQATVKSATELEKIVSCLQLVVEKQDKIVDRIFNGMVHEIIDGITKNYDNTHKETITALKELKEFNEKFPVEVGEKLNSSSIAKDIEHTKWFVGIVGVIVICATVILRGIDNRNVLQKELGMISQLRTTNEDTLSKMQK